MNNMKLNGGRGHNSCQIANFVVNFGRDLNSSNQSKAFTLAEVLVTTVIIGVVAALTIPSVVVSYKKHQTVTKLKKAYSSISQTTNKAIADYGPVKNWEIENGNPKAFVDKYLAPYLNVIRNCEYGITGECKFENKRLDKPNDSPSVFNENYYKLVLSDGTALISSVVINENIKALQLNIDINGQNGPNIYGKDIFTYVYWIYYVDSKGQDDSGKFMPNGWNNLYSRDDIRNSGCKIGGRGYNCAALIMHDNWQIKNDYPW